jgi:hypothetical protein
MKTIPRFIKLVLLTSTLTVGCLTVAATTSSSALAASGPSVSAFGKGGGVQVYGSGCTPGSWARVELLTPGLTSVLATRWVLTSGGTWGGYFDTLLNTSYVGNVYVALDCRPGPTAWAQAYVYPAPWITVSGYNPGNYPDTSNLYVEGSGFTPGTWEHIVVYIQGTWTQLADQWVRANTGTSSEDGFIYAEFHIHYIGNILAIAYGSPHNSNWAGMYEWAG